MLLVRRSRVVAAVNNRWRTVAPVAVTGAVASLPRQRRGWSRFVAARKMPVQLFSSCEGAGNHWLRDVVGLNS